MSTDKNGCWRQSYKTQKFIHRCPQGHIAQSVSSIPSEGSGELSGDNWYPLNMARGNKTVYPGEQNKGLYSTFQPPEEGRSIQWPKCCDKHGNKNEDNILKNVNNVHGNVYICVCVCVYIYIY